MDHLPAKCIYKWIILPFRISDDDVIPGGKESVGDLPLCGKRFTRTGRSQNQAVRLFVKRNFSRDGKNQAGKAPWTVKSRFRGWVVKPLPRPAPGLGAHQEARIHRGLGAVPQA